MRRIIAITAAVVLGFVGAASAGPMANTKHDLSSGSTASIHSSGGSATDQLCIFCHTPHNGDPAAGRPLWNHTLTTQDLTWTPATTVRGTTLPTSYAGGTLGGSQACMSCHDGTVAIGQVIYSYAAGGGTTFTLTTPSKVTGGKLNSNSSALMDPAAMETNHPVGVPQPGVVTGFTAFKAPAAGQAVQYDADGNVQCGSCHNPHLTGTVNNPAPFLKKTNAGSAICVTCHDL